MYKQVKIIGGGIANNQIIRILDNAVIPFDQDNTDYQEYLAWLADGNQPLPADE